MIKTAGSVPQTVAGHKKLLNNEKTEGNGRAQTHEGAEQNHAKYVQPRQIRPGKDDRKSS